MKKILMTIAGILFPLYFYTQNFFRNVHIELGFAKMLNLQNGEDKLQMRISPHAGINYQNTIYRRWSYELGLHYIYKPFLDSDLRTHNYNRHGQIVHSQSHTVKKINTHNLAVPVKIGYFFPHVRFQPIAEIGIIPQYSQGGRYSTESHTYINGVLQSKQIEKYSIKDTEKVNYYNFRSLQYLVGLQFKINSRFKLSSQYIFNSSGVGLTEKTDNPMDCIIDGASFKDNQFRISIKYSLSK